MSIETREVDIVNERESLVPFLREHLPAHRNPRYYDWLYMDNPFGRGRAWVAELQENREMVGIAAAFPRLVHVRGQDVTCWNLGDFAIGPEFRSLGPAVQLQRRCLQDVLSGDVPFAYDHPSCNMMAVYRWMKISATGEVIRYAKPLRVDGKVEAVIGKGVLTRGISGVGNVVLSLIDRQRITRARPTSLMVNERFDDRVNALDRQLASARPVVGARTPEYLNWRYLDSPHAEFGVVAASGEQGLHGYAVFSKDEGVATVADLVCGDDASVADVLLTRLVETLKPEGIRTLNVPVLGSSPLIPYLERWGFKPRETHAFVVSAKRGDLSTES